MISLNNKNKIRRICYDNRYLLAAFVIPVLVMWLIYISMEVYPFGNNSVLVLDLNGQYVYFFEELRKKILDGGSLLYTWRRSLGGEFSGIFAYYLSDPLSFLVALFPEDHITEYLLLLILTKVGLMGTTMAYYLNNVHPTRKLNTIIFSTCYAMSAYAVVMAHNTMWFADVILLPLVALGIEKLIKKHDFKLFVISLSLSLITSFYIGYMTCLFVILYFFYYYIAHDSEHENNFWREENHFWKSLLRIGIYSLIAICIAMIIIYPAYTSLQFGKSTFSDTEYTFDLRFDILDFFSKLFPGSYDTVRPEGLPFIYCGVLTLIMVPLYFITSRIRWQERMMGGVILTVLFLCFNINAIDIIWHGFQKPNWLNYRYSYMLTFLMLVMAYKAFGYLKYANYKHVVIIIGFLALMLVFIQKQDFEWIEDYGTILLSILCLGVFCVVLWLLYSKAYKYDAVPVIALLVCIELFVAGLLNTVALDEDVVISSRDSYNNIMNKLQPVVDQVYEYDTSPFFRMEKTYHRKTNDPMRLGFNGISNSTSTLNQSVIDLLHRYGYASKSHWTKYLGGTPVSDAYLGIKYVISENEIDNGIYSLIAENTPEGFDFRTYKNPYALSLAFASNENIKSLQITDYDSPLELMNELTSAVTGGTSEDIFEKVELLNTEYVNISTGFTTQHRKYSKSDSSSDALIIYTVSVPRGKPIYMCIPTDYPRECDLYVNGICTDTYLGNESDCVYYLGIFEEDEDITVKLKLKSEPIYIKNGQNYFFALNNDVFKTTFESLSEGNLNITSFEDTRIEGTINVPTGMSVMSTSIPYDDGWHIYVDGEEKELIRISDSLLAVEISEGSHEVVMKYMPKCFVVGLFISIAGVIAFAVAIIIDTRKKRRLHLSSCQSTDDNSIDTVITEEDHHDLSDDISNDVSDETDDISTNDNNDDIVDDSNPSDDTQNI